VYTFLYTFFMSGIKPLHPSSGHSFASQASRGVSSGNRPSVNLWTSQGHAQNYLERADSILHRGEGESTLLEFIPASARRILDLGTGDGRLLALVRQDLAGRTPDKDASGKDPRGKDAPGKDRIEAVAVDFSPTMLEAARKRFTDDSSVTVVAHNLDESLPALGRFDAVISSFAIHHLVHERKRALYREIYDRLNPGGVFCNLEHVASPSRRLHEEFLHSIGYTVETEDPSNKLLDLERQLGWLREIGFVDVDCHWKWRELALLVGRQT
jgi:tRNA (cmo5U34)-methyltransferase